ncbi:glycosyltransferase [Methylobacterium durans]|uniref:Glycosyl transferase family 1 domain-containing protein n=1 Tax=Methylobacterium durans TaxID=2202825 RepID=A0A2U8W3Q4_9HYPH|nr:glycosyltransferase [Methylobacterium durans]AWN39992.1 hypothetical protein DK389_04825 [Methylobacterium durans]
MKIPRLAKSLLRLARLPHRSGSRQAPEGNLRGNIDVCHDGVLCGWAFDPHRPDSFVTVEMRMDGSVLFEQRADQFRADLREAGIGSGYHGFMFKLDDELWRKASAPGTRVEIRAIGRPPLLMGQVSFSDRFGGAGIEALPLDLIRGSQERAARAVAATPDRPDEAADEAPARAQAPIYRKLLHAPEESRAETGSDRTIQPPLSPFAAQLRDRLGLREHFATPEEQDHFYRWYIDYYAARRPLRAPFSAAEIAHLNEPVIIGGQPYALSRAALWYALEDDGIRTVLDLSKEAGYRRVLYWWASTKVRALNVEDCLVSYRQVSFLQAITPAERGAFLPFSRFVTEALLQHPDLTWVRNTCDTQTRIACYYVVLLEAAEEPGLLRFVPREVLDYFLLGPDPQFDAVSAAIGAAGATIDRRTYLAEIKARGFDIERQVFGTTTRDGDRIDPHRLVASPAATSQPFIQVIAPFDKASGLATAGRSTRSVLLGAGLPSRFANFSIENPQPVVADDNHDRQVALGAAINVIHINPDLLPLVFAHSPDVFTGAYNIGFFFWELDKIAANHNLALELVDEIWVGSEYNRRCFAQATDKPVHNMRLAMPPLGAGDTAKDRALMNNLFGTRADDFVFFTSYDSFSYTSRKNPLAVIRAFHTAFPPGETGVRLIIKTHNAAALTDPLTLRAWRHIADACEGDPRIAIVDRTMRHDEVLGLIAAADCYVSLHRSEGFGLGMMEAMQRRTPVVCTGYSGNADFCDAETAWPVAYDLVPTGATEYAYVEPGHVWAEPRHASAVEALRAVRGNAEERQRRVENAAHLVAQAYEPTALVPLYRDRIAAILRARSPRL